MDRLKRQLESMERFPGRTTRCGVVEIGGQEFHLFASKGGKFTNRHRWASEEGSVETGFTWHTEARLTLIPVVDFEFDCTVLELVDGGEGITRVSVVDECPEMFTFGFRSHDAAKAPGHRGEWSSNCASVLEVTGRELFNLFCVDTLSGFYVKRELIARLDKHLREFGFGYEFCRDYWGDPDPMRVYLFEI
jgi:hypothetical protein